MEKERVSSTTVSELDESNERENMKRVEAALFLAGRFLTLQDLVLMTDVNPLMLKEVMDKLIDKYNDEFGMEIIKKENMWKMDVRQEYVSMINKLATGSSEFSKSEQETLAVIAYKQPVKQSVVIKIRGNKAYDHIKNFSSMGLVIGKRVGHTKELRLSDDFFDYFHLQKKDLKNMSKEVIGEVFEKVENVESDEENEDESISVKSSSQSDVSNTDEIGEHKTIDNVDLDTLSNNNSSYSNENERVEEVNSEQSEEIDNSVQSEEEKDNAFNEMKEKVGEEE